MAAWKVPWRGSAGARARRPSALDSPDRRHARPEAAALGPAWPAGVGLGVDQGPEGSTRDCAICLVELGSAVALHLLQRQILEYLPMGYSTQVMFFHLTGIHSHTFDPFKT